MSTVITLDGSRDEKKEKSEILCFDVSDFSKEAQFAICSFGVFFFYLLYGYFQELIFTKEELKEHGWYLTLVQFIFYSIFGLVERKLKNDSERRIPFKVYLLLAGLTVGTMGFSNASLGHLNYPTQVIFKCCKLLPVLLGSVLIQGKIAGVLDYLAAGLMCIGLVLFTLADSQLSPIFDMTGIVMISSALLCDAVIGNVQEKSMKENRASNAEVVFYSYFIGVFIIFVFLVLSGQLLPAFHSCSKHRIEAYGYGFLFSLSGYLGIQIVLQLVRTCGAFAAVTVTTCRKAVTIVISFLAFEKPFAFAYVYSGFIVVLGIYLSLYAKKNPNFSLVHLSRNMIQKLDRSGIKYKKIPLQV